MRTLVSGGTGFIGRALIGKLPHPVVLSRPGSSARALLDLHEEEFYDWEPTVAAPPVSAFDGVGSVIHLTGEPLIQGRWSRAKERRVRESRILGTRHLVQALIGLPKKPRTLVAASAVGYYGDRGDEILEEQAVAGDDFLAQLCRAWEEETVPAAESGIRVVNLRIGVVLGRDSGALRMMLPIFKLGLGGRLGSGRQWTPWIHIEDLTNLIVFALQTVTLRGPVNASAPHPVTNAEFTSMLGKVLHRPTFLPVPARLLQLRFGKVAQVLLASQRAVPRAATTAGFSFQFAHVKEALENLLTT